MRALLAGRLYVNVHSAAFQAGEIRGQIVPDTVEVVFSPMSGGQVVPPVTTSASGVAATTLDSATNLASVHANATGVHDATEAHVHKAAAGSSNAAALFTLTKDSVSAGHWSIEQQATPEADRTDFAAGGWYIDVHTPASPGGALRGQLSASGAAPTLTQLQSSIFTPRCSSCHTGSGGSLPGVMNLSSAAATHAALVGVASLEQPTVLRVVTGDAANSYVVHKLEGAASISGARMPLGGPFLDQATIDQVKAWINAGAQNN
jgi:mono/diheme cytochrome c family protein